MRRLPLHAADRDVKAVDPREGHAAAQHDLADIDLRRHRVNRNPHFRLTVVHLPEDRKHAAIGGQSAAMHVQAVELGHGQQRALEDLRCGDRNQKIRFKFPEAANVLLSVDVRDRPGLDGVIGQQGAQVSVQDSADDQVRCLDLGEPERQSHEIDRPIEAQQPFRQLAPGTLIQRRRNVHASQMDRISRIDRQKFLEELRDIKRILFGHDVYVQRTVHDVQRNRAQRVEAGGSEVSNKRSIDPSHRQRALPAPAWNPTRRTAAPSSNAKSSVRCRLRRRGVVSQARSPQPGRARRSQGKRSAESGRTSHLGGRHWIRTSGLLLVRQAL